MDLPSEIRQLIYNEVFQDATIAYERVRVQVGNAHCFFLKFRADETSDHRNVLMACKEIYEEAIEFYRQRISTLVILDEQKVEEGPLITKKTSGQVADFVLDGSLEVISPASKLELLRLPALPHLVDLDFYESADDYIFQGFQRHLHTYVPDFDKPGQNPIQVLAKVSICEINGYDYCGDYHCDGNEIYLCVRKIMLCMHKHD